MEKYKASRRKQGENIVHLVRQSFLRYNAKNMIHEREKMKNLASSLKHFQSSKYFKKENGK